MATSPAPVPIQRGRRAKPRRAHRDPPPRASRGAKKNHTRASSSTAAHSTSTTNPPFSWGAKRARTTVSVGGGSRSCARDWANLGGEGPAGLIADLLARSDVADYVRFRAVCRSWRRCSPEVPRDSVGLDGRLLPRQWIMLDRQAHLGRYRFLNVSTGKCALTDLPELEGHKLLAITPEGLLLLLHETTLVVRLLNPLTRQLTDLPRLHELLRSRRYSSARNLQVYGVGLVAVAGVCAVAVCFFSDPMVLAVAKSGDESWTVVHKGHSMISTLPFAGRFYCVDADRGLMVLDLDMSSSDQQQPPRLRKVADLLKGSRLSQISYGLHLVDNGGELMLVHRARWQGGYYNYRYKVYRVDLEAGILIPAKKQALKGRAVFIGRRRAISVSAGVFPSSVRANTIYLGPECDGQTLGYNVTNGWRELFRRYNPFCPPRAVDCLSYCIDGMC